MSRRRPLTGRFSLSIQQQRLSQLSEFAGRRLSPGSGCDALDLQGANPSSGQLDDRIADAFQHSTYDTISPLVDHNPEYGPSFLVAEWADLLGNHLLALDRHAASQCRQHLRWRMAIEQRFVFLLQFIPRMGDAKGDVSIIG